MLSKFNHDGLQEVNFLTLILEIGLRQRRLLLLGVNLLILPLLDTLF